MGKKKQAMLSRWKTKSIQSLGEKRLLGRIRQQHVYEQGEYAL